MNVESDGSARNRDVSESGGHVQPSLFGDRDNGTLADPERPLMGPFQRHSPTSRAAAIHNLSRGGTQRHRIIAALENAPDGLTREELSKRLGIILNSILPRVVELRTDGWIEECGRTRKTEQGVDASVLELTERARADLDGRDAA